MESTTNNNPLPQVESPEEGLTRKQNKRHRKQESNQQLHESVPEGK
jgi:hypothetical protein